MSQKGVIETCQEWNDRDIIQKRQIAADDEKDLESDEKHSGDVTRVPGPERKPRHDQFDEMVPGRFNFVKPMWCEMEIAADRIRDRLRFVVIIKTCEIAPARIATQLDQTGPDHDAKTEPAKKPDHEERWPAFRKRAAIEQRTKKDRQEAGLQQLRFPTVSVPDLADVNDRHVHRPQDRHHDRVCVAAKNNQ